MEVQRGWNEFSDVEVTEFDCSVTGSKKIQVKRIEERELSAREREMKCKHDMRHKVSKGCLGRAYENCCATVSLVLNLMCVFGCNRNNLTAYSTK